MNKDDLPEQKPSELWSGTKVIAPPENNQAINVPREDAEKTQFHGDTYAKIAAAEEKNVKNSDDFSAGNLANTQTSANNLNSLNSLNSLNNSQISQIPAGFSAQNLQNPTQIPQITPAQTPKTIVLKNEMPLLLKIVAIIALIYGGFYLISTMIAIFSMIFSRAAPLYALYWEINPMLFIATTGVSLLKGIFGAAIGILIFMRKPIALKILRIIVALEIIILILTPILDFALNSAISVGGTFGSVMPIIILGWFYWYLGDGQVKDVFAAKTREISL